MKIVTPDRAEISFPEKEAEIAEGQKSLELGWLKPGEKREVSWKVRTLKPAGTEVDVSVLSTRGGVDKEKLALSPKP